MDNLLLFLIDDQAIDFNAVGELANDLAEPLENLDNGERRNIPRNEDFYEVTIPLYMGDLFKEHFRMSREAFQILRQVISNAMPEMRQKIALDKKLLFTIWVISKPESFLSAGDLFGLARSSAHTIFTEMITVISNLLEEYIRWPAEYNAITEAFQARYLFLIEIKQPVNNANDYYNRNNHSIVLQGICYHTTKFLDVYIGVPGRVQNSPIFAQIPTLPENLHILGDLAYPLMLNVMTPFRDNGHLNQIETNFNIRHSSARAVIERAIGRLKGTFRRLKHLDISTPQLGNTIIAAACVLHNFIILHDGENDDDFQPDIGFEENEVNEPVENRDMAVNKRLEMAELLM